MHIVNISEPIDMGPQGILPAGRLIMEDKNAAEVMLMWPDAGIKIEPYYHVGMYVEERRLKSTLIAGGLGMGDAIMLTPILRNLKNHRPNASITVACFAHYRQALLNLPYIDAFAEWPLPADRLKHYDRVHFLENFQGHHKAREMHLTDVFANICKVHLVDLETNQRDTKADYIPTADELSWAKETFPRVEGRKRLGLQVQASHRCRTYPAAMLRDLMQIMILDGWEVYLMGAPGEFACKPSWQLHDVSSTTFRESAAFLTTCDAFCGPDSGFLHAAGAMSIPAVGLFGAFPWKLRTAYYDSIFAIQGQGACSPCFHSPTKLQPAFPVSGPCFQSGKCEVLASITPDRIAAKLNQIAR